MDAIETKSKSFFTCKIVAVSYEDVEKWSQVADIYSPHLYTIYGSKNLIYIYLLTYSTLNLLTSTIDRSTLSQITRESMRFIPLCCTYLCGCW